MSEASIVLLARDTRTATDPRLLDCVSRGDATAFSELYERHAGAAMGLAQRIVGDPRLAEDVCQEAFLGIWRSAGTYNPGRGTAREWVLGIVRNRAIDALRRRAVDIRRLRPLDQSRAEVASGELTDERALRNDAARAMRPRLDALPGKQREAVTLAFCTGLTHAEIAKVVNAPVGTIKGRIRLGLHKMRERIRADAPQPLADAPRGWPAPGGAAVVLAPSER